MSPGGRAAAGAAWLIYGAASTADVDVASIPERRIQNCRRRSLRRRRLRGIGRRRCETATGMGISCRGAGRWRHGRRVCAAWWRLQWRYRPGGGASRTGLQDHRSGNETGSMLAAGDVNGDGRSRRRCRGSSLHARVVTVEAGRLRRMSTDSSIGSAGFVIWGTEADGIRSPSRSGTWTVRSRRYRRFARVIPVFALSVPGPCRDPWRHHERGARLPHHWSRYALDATGRRWPVGHQRGICGLLRDGRAEPLVATHGAENNGEGSGSVYAVRRSVTLQHVDLGVLSTAWTEPTATARMRRCRSEHRIGRYGRRPGPRHRSRRPEGRDRRSARSVAMFAGDEYRRVSPNRHHAAGADAERRRGHFRKVSVAGRTGLGFG